MSQAPAHDVLWPEGEAFSHVAGLKRLRVRGWRPRCVYDIGASMGGWTAQAAQVFPLAEFHLFEPQAEVQPSFQHGLEALKSRPGMRVTLHGVALDSGEGSRPMGLPRDSMGGSLLVTEASSYFPRVIQVEATSLDTYRAGTRLTRPDLIKIDTQGSELRILKGAQATLRETELVLVEAWLERSYGPDTPLVHEIVGWLHDRDFHVIDTIGGYREGPKLIAFDVLFARSDARIDRR